MSINKQRKLTEGLGAKDLKELVSEVFTVDQYKSKMGEDQDIVVLGFRVKEKFPAVDLMEFIEKGYSFILDADISSGEEHDGQYQVFVEIERSPQLATQLKHLFSGISQLTDCHDWKFRYQKAGASVPFNEETVVKHIPLTPEDYKNKILEYKNKDVKDFFNQGTVEVELDEDNTLTFTKTYSGPIQAEFVAIGDYKDVKDTIPGPLALDESSQSQSLFLNKYLGNYDINKIGNQFLIRNGKQAMVIKKERW
jgi:hypothetical protein